jgi:nucleoside-diphosphate-sugar epimerase
VRDLEIDSVVEVSWQPDLVRSALEALADPVVHWVYVSSVSVYTDDATPRADESAEIHSAWASTGQVGIEQYGPAKVACEQAVRDRLAERCTIARAGLVAGYGDRSDRFGYWPARLARAADAEPVLVPPLDTPVQVIDVLDLATWLVDCAERRTSGTFNATGDALPFERVLAACASAAGRRHSTRRNDAAKAAGLGLRPVEDTARHALRWERELGLDRPRRAGLTPERESSLLSALAPSAG